ncbi:MAG: GatB/YqeY domain-containing protein [Acidobacteria bacterium]|nr:GatB/YqeY domain-containing protein [Acidobacteriota bacterium]
MSQPQERVQNDLKTAMKAGDKERISTLRLLLTELKNERIRAGEEVDEERFAALVRRALKQRQESAEQFRQGNRPEMAEREEREAELLTAYLPAQVGEDQIRAAVRDFVAAEGLTGPAAIGAVMKAMIARFGSAADGREINRIAREVLSAGG